MAQAKGITKINYVADLGKSPARVNRYTGECWINLKIWNQLPFEQRLFVLLHENAHVALCTTNELEADSLAFAQYAERGHKLTEAILSLTRILNFSNSEHYLRANVQLERAKLYDYHINGNEEAIS